MSEELENKTKDLCYKIKEIYSRQFNNIATNENINKINMMFLGVDNGVVRHVIDFLTQKDASKEEFSNFVEEIIKNLKEETKTILKPKDDDSNSIDILINDTYNDIIKCIVKSQKELTKAIKKEENKTEKNKEKPEAEENNEDYENEETPETPEEELEKNIKNLKLDPEEAQILAETLGINEDNELLENKKTK